MSERFRTAMIWCTCGFLFLVFGGIATWIAAHHLHELRSFRPVEATILSGAVQRISGKHENYHPHYSPSIQYAYVVEGQPYTSWTYRSMGWRSEREWSAQEIVDRYPAGSMHVAWYDTKSPGTAVLVRELNGWGLALSLAGCALPIAMLVLHRFGLFRRRSAPGRGAK